MTATATQTEFYTTIDSPIGQLLLTGDNDKLTGLHMMGAHDYSELMEVRDEDRSPFSEAINQLEEYFAGTRTDFDLKLDARGTEFQTAVWDALLDIPYAQTRSYGEIAFAIGKPKAPRAVGMANNRNPIAVIIPCHRVIGANGSLVGYGGGLNRKTWLLTHEQSVAANPHRART